MEREKPEQSTDPPQQLAAEFVGRGLGGDLPAFRTLVDTFQKYAYALAFRILGEEEESKDAVQEAFIRVWQHRGKYDPKVRFTTWLYTIVTRLCYDKLRGMRRRNTVPFGDGEASHCGDASSGDDAERLYSNKEIAALVNRLSRQLPPKQRVVFVLRDLQGLSVREVAGILRISESSVKANLVYARKFLRSKLDPILM